MRVIGLDYGEKTIGVAVSDPFILFAQGLFCLRRSDEQSVNKSIERLIETIRQYEADTVVLGYPKNMNNTEGPRCEKTRLFKEKLEKHLTNAKLKADIVLWDERMSTVAANRSLIEMNVSRSKKKEQIDTMAAIYILQGYLDSLKKS